MIFEHAATEPVDRLALQLTSQTARRRVDVDPFNQPRPKGANVGEYYARKIMNTVINADKDVNMKQRVENFVSLLIQARRTFGSSKPHRFMVPLMNESQLEMFLNILEDFASSDYVSLSSDKRLELLKIIYVPTTAVIPLYIACRRPEVGEHKGIDILAQWLQMSPLPAQPMESIFLPFARKIISQHDLTQNSVIVDRNDYGNPSGILKYLQSFENWWRYLAVDPLAINSLVANHLIELKLGYKQLAIKRLKRIFNSDIVAFYYNNMPIYNGDHPVIDKHHANILPMNPVSDRIIKSMFNAGLQMYSSDDAWLIWSHAPKIALTGEDLVCFGFWKNGANTLKQVLVELADKGSIRPVRLTAYSFGTFLTVLSYAGYHLDHSNKFGQKFVSKVYHLKNDNNFSNLLLDRKTVSELAQLALKWLY